MKRKWRALVKKYRKYLLENKDLAKKVKKKKNIYTSVEQDVQISTVLTWKIFKNCSS